MDKKGLLYILGESKDLALHALGLVYEHKWWIVGALIFLILVCYICFHINKLIASCFESLIKVLCGFVCLAGVIIAVACFVNSSILGGVCWGVLSLLAIAIFASKSNDSSENPHHKDF